MLFFINYISKKVYIITAVSIDIEDRTIIVELIKDIANSFCYEDATNKENTRVHKMFDEMRKIVNEDPLTEIYNRRYIDERLPIDNALKGLSLKIKYGGNLNEIF